MKLRDVLVTIVGMMFCSTAAFSGSSQGVLFEDDFSGSEIDPVRWHLQENAGGYWSTLHFDETLPYAENGYARLPLETYDPNYPGQMVRASYLQAGGPNVDNVKHFCHTYGPTRTELRFRMVNPGSGHTSSLTYHGSSSGGGVDEMDFEYHTEDPLDRVLGLSTWEGWDHNGRVAINFPDLTGIINAPPAWNTYRLDWYTDKVEFYLNDELIWTSTQYIPDDYMGLKIPHFVYSQGLGPVSDPNDNFVAYYDIDHVRVSLLDDQGDLREETFHLIDNFDYHSMTQVDDINLDLYQRQLGILPMAAPVTYVETGTPQYVSDGEAFLDSFNTPPHHLALMTYPGGKLTVTAEHDFGDLLDSGDALNISIQMNPDTRNGTGDATSNYAWMTVGGYQDQLGGPGTIGVTMRNNGTWFFNVDGGEISGTVPYMDEQWHQWNISITPVSGGNNLIDVELNGELVVEDYLLSDPNFAQAYINLGAYTYSNAQAGQHWYGFDELIVSTTPSEHIRQISFQNGATGYDGTEDTYVKNWVANDVAAGQENFFFIGRPFDSSYITRSLLKFDNLTQLQGKYKSIRSAKVVLRMAYADSNDFDDFDMTIHEVKPDNYQWIESQSCWSYERYDWSNPEAQWAGGLLGAPVYGCGAEGVDYVAAPMDTVAADFSDADGKMVEFEIDTALVEKWVNGLPNAGLLLKTELQDNIYRRGFYSSETSNIAWRPQLVINYLPTDTGATAKFQEGVLEYEGTEDFYMLNYNGALTGSEGFFYIGRPWDPTHIARSLIRFDNLGSLRGKYESIDSVKLVLTVAYADQNPSAGAFDISLHEVLPANVEWTEDDSNWPYKRTLWGNPEAQWAGGLLGTPVYGCGAEDTDHVAVPMDVVTSSLSDSDGDKMEFSVDTNLVEQWITGGANAGVLLKTELLSDIYRRGFYSSNYSDVTWRPQLVVTYTPKTTTATAGYQDGVLGYAGTEDAYVKNWETNAITGSENFFYIGRPFDSAHIARSLIRFDNLSDMQGKYEYIDSAKLLLTVAYTDGNNFHDFDMTLHEVLPADSNWIESQSCWSYERYDWSNPDAQWEGGLLASVYGCGAEGIDHVGTPMDTVPASETDADGLVLEFDVNPVLVEQWINGGTNAGLLLKTDLYDDFYLRGFYSSEQTDIGKRPQLLVNYVPKEGPAQISYRQGVNSYANTEDTYLLNYNPNYVAAGSEQFFFVGRPWDPSHIARSLLRFGGLTDMQGKYQSIDSAKVVLTTAYADGWGFDITAHEVLEANKDWTQSQSCWSYERYDWSNPDAQWEGGTLASPVYGCGVEGVDHVTSPMGTVEVYASDGDQTIATFNVNPDLVESWIEGGNNAGILLKSDLQDSIYRRGYYSSEETQVEWRPKLVISYTPVVNLDFLSQFAGNWLDTDCDADNDWCQSCDWTRDNKVNFYDFAEVAEKWLNN